MTLGLVGMGRIGRAVAIRAGGFRVRVVAFDTIVDAEFDRRHGIARLPLDELLATADAVSLHVPLTETTRGMVNRDFLARMRPGSYLINTSRGGPGRRSRSPRCPGLGTSCRGRTGRAQS